MLAKIFQPARGATQSGQGKTHVWVLEFVPDTERQIDPLMGWTSSTDMNAQVRLNFPTREAAVAYAQANGIAHQIEQPNPRRPVIKPGGYGGNFAYDRKEAWTH